MELSLCLEGSHTSSLQCSHICSFAVVLSGECISLCNTYPVVVQLQTTCDARLADSRAARLKKEIS